MLHILRFYEKTVRSCHRVTVDGACSRELAQQRTLLKPWVARITGTCGKFGLEREFVTPYRDYENASRSGRRIERLFALRPGVYQVHEITSAKYAQRYFLTILADGATRETTRGELESMTGAPFDGELSVRLRNRTY